ncbi:hypothetical protein OB955_14400 [Halobacteria archaeon AArc-m2/3/4]|uniref:Zinc transporter, ZIP family n=1 Tax=Natronoglomus mannanivorans TaxID=2979990 RepID=A0ABT2QGA4_9EURY|nr:hypothetical protein [Halobacteria archaeon AArc-m2/3/4]
MVDYYDTILAAIAGSVLGGVLLASVTTLSLSVGLFLGSLVAIVFVYDAMFRNPPLPPMDPRIAASVVVWHALLFALALATFVG